VGRKTHSAFFMDKVETRKVLLEKASRLGIKESLLKNLTSGSIKKVIDHEQQVRKEKEKFNGTREIPGYRA